MFETLNCIHIYVYYLMQKLYYLQVWSADLINEAGLYFDLFHFAPHLKKNNNKNLGVGFIFFERIFVSFLYNRDVQD